MEFGETGDLLTDTFSILSFERGAPLDDLKTANVTLAPSALSMNGYPSVASGAALPGETGGDDGGDDGGENPIEGDTQTAGNP